MCTGTSSGIRKYFQVFWYVFVPECNHGIFWLGESVHEFKVQQLRTVKPQYLKREDLFQEFNYFNNNHITN